ncbi:MAG: acyltransferase [Candidatus Delongbacteria bacterium]|jgi:acetyltransferase-like isoleucine patch superfamily enzyme|nr:acyltransferase [Candidatus Delongbacteria bacterium]
MKYCRFLFRILGRNFFIHKIRIVLLRFSGIVIGKDSYVNMNVHFIDNYRGNAIKIGDRVAIAPGATFIADSDPNNSKLNTIEKYLIKGEVIINDDAWIGSNVIILPNITIGKKAIVGAGSVVTRNVDDNTIVAGNPAKVIGTVKIEK